MKSFVRSALATVLGAVVLSCGEATHPTGPDSSGNGPQIKADAISSEGAGGPSITTDKRDYSPGDTVTITGTGWQANESVSLLLSETPDTNPPTAWAVIADSVGGFADRTFVVNQSHLGVAFQLVATGAASADTAQGTFTDAPPAGLFNVASTVNGMTLNWTSYNGTTTCSGGTTRLTGSGLSIPTTGTFVDTVTATRSISLTVGTTPTGMSLLNWTGPSTKTGTTVCYPGSGSNQEVTANWGFLTTTALTASPADSVQAGLSVTFNAHVTKNSDVSNVTVNKVSFYDGGTDCTTPGTQIGAAAGLNGSGIASVSTSTLSVGTHTIWACYEGKNTPAPPILPSGTSITYKITPGPDSTAVALVADIAPSVTGQVVTYTATVTMRTGGAAVTTGSVEFQTGGSTCANGTPFANSATALNGSGVSTDTRAFLASETGMKVRACYSGVPTVLLPSDTTITQTVNKAPTTTNVVTDGTPVNSGTLVTFTATVTADSPGSGTPAGNVKFYQFHNAETCNSPGANTGMATQALNGSGVATYATDTLSAGSHTIHACYQGDANYTFSNDFVVQVISATGTEVVVTASPADSAVVGESVTFTGTVRLSSDHSTAVTVGTLSFHEDTCAGTELQAAATVDGSGQKTYITSALALGSHTIVGCYTGSGGFQDSDGSLSYKIIKANTTTTLALKVGSNPSEFGDALKFKATVSVTAPGSGTPTGNVSFYQFTGVESCSALGTASPMSTLALTTDSAILTVDSLAVGSHDITACYEGDTNYNGSGSSAVTQVVNPKTTIDSLFVVPGTQQYSDTVTLTSKIGPFAILGEELTGTIYFYVDTAPVSCGTSAPAGSVGSVAIDADSAGVGSFNYRVTKPKGSYTVTSCFYSSSSSFKSSNTSGSLTVNAENGLIYDMNSDVVSVNATSHVTTIPIVLTLKVKERFPETNSISEKVGPGGIDSAVVLSVVSAKGVLTPSNTANFTCAKVTSSGSGYARYATWSCTAPAGVSPDTYEVPLVLGAYTDGGLYYADSTTGIVQVTDPTLGFATGGGWFQDGDDRVNFGFQAKATVNKNKTVYQGGLLVVRHKPNGDEIRIKSNVFDGYTVSGNAATFTGKATYSVNGVTSMNQQFTGYAQDIGQPGVGVDKFGLYYASPGNLIATSTTLAGLPASAKTIGGGNVQVPQTSGKK